MLGDVGEGGGVCGAGCHLNRSRLYRSSLDRSSGNLRRCSGSNAGVFVRGALRRCAALTAASARGERWRRSGRGRRPQARWCPNQSRFVIGFRSLTGRFAGGRPRAPRPRRLPPLGDAVCAAQARQRGRTKRGRLAAQRATSSARRPRGAAGRRRGSPGRTRTASRAACRPARGARCPRRRRSCSACARGRRWCRPAPCAGRRSPRSSTNDLSIFRTSSGIQRR